jgi:hypothetical protein
VVVGRLDAGQQGGHLGDVGLAHAPLHLDVMHGGRLAVAAASAAGPVRDA